MSYGQGNIQNLANVLKPSGPPFESDSADNGLSVDAVSGRIVLGNNQGDPAAPAQLLSGREITTGPFNIIFRATPGAGAFTSMFAGNVITGNPATGDQANIAPGIFGANGANGNNYGIDMTGANSTVDVHAVTGSGGSGIANTIYRNGFGAPAIYFEVRANSNTSADPGYILEDRSSLAGIKIFASGRTFVGVTTPAPVDSGTAQLQVGGSIITAAGAPLTAAPVPFRIGSVVVAAAALDATQYLETVVNGVLVKLAMIV